jgi:hypothetical protein
MLSTINLLQILTFPNQDEIKTENSGGINAIRPIARKTFKGDL